MNLKEKIDQRKLPVHIAVIMDGNGRWAERKGKARVFGHRNGVKSVREISEACAELGVRYLTLYAFSTENWNRPRLEISALMELLVRTIRNETKTLTDNNIRLQTIGNLDVLPKRCARELEEAMEITESNSRMDLILALSYSGRFEITQALKAITTKVEQGEIQAESIDEELVNKYLFTHNIPDPELLIRTSGEKRISNFLLWQMAYTELYFTEKLWPEFRKKELYEAIIDFQERERRFGKTSQQVSTKDLSISSHK